VSATFEGRHMNIRNVILAIGFGATALFAQNSNRPAFEVASIRPSAGAPPQGVAVGIHIDGAQFRTSYLTVKDYIGMAYRVKLYQISGPDWIGTDRFDVAATLPDGSLPAQIPDMMQSLLADRFQMSFHREQKESPVYGLEVAKTGLKMTLSPPNPELDNPDARAPQAFTGAGTNQGVSINLGGGASYTFSNNRFEGKRLAMATFAASLERFLDRPVVDTTDVKGNYDFSFDVTTEDYQAMLVRAAVVAGVILPPPVLKLIEGAPTPTSLFDGLEKLGLRLVARKAPLDVIVIDKVSKTPTEN
jgi:uncharacterized protein (TIGR03435 family)